ncbi:unnamed protein product [Sympodiomycopsis kandeliae]
MLPRHLLKSQPRICLLHTSGSPVRTLSTSSRVDYAQPLNPSTSVDPRLGISPPRAPTAGSEDGGQGHYSVSSSNRPNNPNDLSELLKGLNSSSSSSPSSAGTKSGSISSIKGTAIGSTQQRKGTSIPSTTLDEFTLLEEESKQKSTNLVNKKASSVDRELPHSIDDLNGRNELDERILIAAKAVYQSQKGSSIKTLNEQFSSKAYTVLPIELPYESTPSEERRVPIARQQQQQQPNDDGVLLIAYVDNVNAPRGQEKISVCTGFGVEGGRELNKVQQQDGGELMVTIAHTLRSSMESSSSSSDSSAALAITRSGQIYPIQSLVSSLPSSDLILLQLAKESLPVAYQQDSTTPQAGIKTLPISPYPAPQESHLCVSSFWGFEDDSGCALPQFNYSDKDKKLSILSDFKSSPHGRSSAEVESEGDSMAQSRWGEVRLIEYKDGKGSEAQPGTYDSLETLEYKLVTDSKINPTILKGLKPDYIPQQTVSLHQQRAQGSSGGSTSSAAAVQQSNGMGFGGYGIPNFPPPGSSGGPIIDVESGSVVGITRGSKMTTLGGRRGEGIPSEKIFEFFTLPGLSKVSRK